MHAQLSWTQYKLLLSVDNEEKREFYVAETKKNNWTSRRLSDFDAIQLFQVATDGTVLFKPETIK